MARLRNAPAAEAHVATQRSTRQVLKEKTNIARPRKPVYEFKENIEELVKPGRPRRRPAKEATKDENEFVMAGGLGEAHADAYPQEAGGPQATVVEVSKTDRTDAPNAKANRRPPRMMRKVIQKEAKSNALDDLKRRMLASNTQAAPAAFDSPAVDEPAMPNSSVLDKLHSSSRPSNEASKKRLRQSSSTSPPQEGRRSVVMAKRTSLAKPASASKSINTPAIERSALALKNFKRRPRQPSMLQMVKQRTASARPSLVNTSAMQDLRSDDIEEINDFDEEEFAPDAVGTPFNFKKVAPAIQSDSMRKRKIENLEGPSSTSKPTRSKRRKPAEVDADEEDPIIETQSRQVSTEPQLMSLPETPAEVQVINSSPSSDLTTDSVPIVRSSFAEREPAVRSSQPGDQAKTRSRPDDQNNADDIMADPLSSSSPSYRPVTMSTADIMADPVTQVSPQRRRQRTQQDKAKPVTTARLQSLLPKRRMRPQPRSRKSDYDLDSGLDSKDQEHSSDADNEDEGVTSANRRRTNSKPRATSRKTTATVKSKGRPSKPLSRKSKVPVVKARNVKSSKASKTYARTRANTTTSDKENDQEAASAFEDLPDDDPSALPDTSITMIEAAQSAELEAARKKFADIDDWEMEFESMTVEEGRSSSQEWR